MKENRRFLAVTRRNAVWRCPIMTDGSLSKVGTYLQLSGDHGGHDNRTLFITESDTGSILACELPVPGQGDVLARVR